MPRSYSSMLPVGAALAALATAGPAQSHWAFEPPLENVPAVQNVGWCRDEIDRCVLAGLEARGLQPSPEADPALLLRRVHLVLTGLPPSPAQVEAFVAEPSDRAYERIIDALLASQQCAEHLATTWLDLARFADTYGYQSDFDCRTWPWRDWLIRSLHEDKPWDRFVREILAGDLLPDASVETVAATAFWRLHRQTNEGGSIEEEWRHEYIADRVDTFGTAFLGLTVGCARCHDHKSDPISQRDYYALGSFFAIDESGLYPYSTGGIPQPTVRLTTPEQDFEIAALEAKVAAHEAECADRAVERAEEPVVSRQELLECDGDTRTAVKGVPAFTRADPFRIRLQLWCPDRKERAVVLHTSRYTLEADTQGYQILIRNGRLCWEIVHHWPGSAIALRTVAELPLQRWVEVEVSYDGSSRAGGLAIELDGERVAAATVRDHLRGPATVRSFELGGRDRDRGFAGGKIKGLCIYDDCISIPARGLRDARRELHAYVEAIPELMVMASHTRLPERFVLRRGAYDEPDRAQRVLADVPDGMMPYGNGRRTRLGLAEWLLDPAHPLTNRVVVDRLWAQCFGRGLTATPDNFGVTGARPHQQVLLDALACDFAAERSVRAMLRRIVCSATFRQSSTVTAAERARDPDNERLARGPSFRLSAEVLRDQALAASGLLHQQVGGPSCKPWQPPGLWRDAGVGWSGADYTPDAGPNAHRRSLYTYRKRTAPPPNMTVLDAPSRETCIARRQSTDTPLQALLFWNDPVFTECADALAGRALEQLPRAGLERQLRYVFASLAARQPRAEELQALLRLGEVTTGDRQTLALAASTLMASDAVVVLR